MDKKSQDFSMEEVKALAQSPAGQQLLTLLQQSDSSKLQQAVDAANTGDYASAAHILNKMLTPQMRKMAENLKG